MCQMEPGGRDQQLVNRIETWPWFDKLLNKNSSEPVRQFN